jgi:hypothetical protein
MASRRVGLAAAAAHAVQPFAVNSFWRNSPHPCYLLGYMQSHAVTLTTLSLSVTIACSSPSQSQDAAIDASVDASVDAGPCGTGYFLTGDLVDWDSTTANFRGIFNALVLVDSDATRTDRTSPNGRFELCVAAAPRTRLSVDAPTPYIDGLIVADQTVIAATGSMSVRSFTATRAASFFTEQNVAGGFDNSKAQLLIQVVGTPRTITIDQASTSLQRNNDTWSPGAIGIEVLFVNLNPAAGMTTVSSTGTVLGAGSVPLAAGKLTFATIVLQ